MRILMWVSFYWPQIGGVETITRQLALALRRKGHTVCVITAHGHQVLPDESDDNGIAVHRFPFWQAIEQRDPLLMLQVQKRVTALKKEFAPDVIHLNCVDASIFFHLRTSSEPRTPSALTLHWTPSNDVWSADTTFGKALRNTHWLVAVSQHQLHMIQDLVPEMVSHASLIPNGLEAPALSVMALDPSAPHILCIGRLVPDKGFDVAFDAFAAIAPEFPHCRLVLAGDGPEGEALRQRAHTLGIAAQTDFLGWVSHEDVPALINQSYMVVMPSRVEPFGLVAVEAGQMARPIIATAVGGLVDIVVDDENGILVANEDSPALAHAMARLLHSPTTAMRMGAAGQQRASALFAAEDNTTMYETLFTRFITEPSDVAR